MRRGFAVSLCRLGIDGWEIPSSSFCSASAADAAAVSTVVASTCAFGLLAEREECLMVQGFDACTAILPLRHAHQF